MIVVTNTLDAIAGSTLNFLRLIGINIPNKPATIIFKTIDIDIIKDKITSLNHNWTIAALITAKIMPFKIPIEKVRKVKSFDRIRNGGLFLTTVKKTPIAICIIEDLLLKPKRVFNTKNL